MTESRGSHIHIIGIVQGVGFRPFVYGLASRLALTGWVRNTSAGVDIVVDGPPEKLDAFITALQEETPPLARIDQLEVEEQAANGFTGFEIVHSEAIEDAFQPISPDVSICPDCLRELFDPADRRYRYPFINCTNCGPRFTIIADIPYDRPKTTMAGFPLCPECAAEYADPLDRRFHAQPVACPACGPQVWLEESGQSGPSAVRLSSDEAILGTQQRLMRGEILAIKGLGGFHLACDALNPAAVDELRRRKLRVDKPFALMMPNLETVEAHCFVSPAERELLTSRQRPIVILRRRTGSQIAAAVSPQQDTVGVMLPYTPLHYLLFAAPPQGTEPPADGLPSALVMTSGNLSEEPIAVDNEEARERLSGLADAFLMHNRPIHTRCDDSVVRAAAPGVSSDEASNLLPIRRSRGYAPDPVRLPFDTPPILAAGAELKNTFCLTHDRYAFLSHHIGDLENYETLRSFEDGIEHFERLFRVQPQALAYDLHPDYLATRYALERAARQGLPATGVQHHHAHIAACMAEHGLPEDRQVLGVSFDGAGYGEDGAIWGGEFLLANYAGYTRLAHFAYTPLPGGDAATRKPARIALAHLWAAGLEWEPGLSPVSALTEVERYALRAQLESRTNTPLTSSAGRLFDAVAALCGVRQQVNYEGQAAIELEALAEPHERGEYSFPAPRFQEISTPQTIDTRPLVRAILDDLHAGVPAPVISARFHNGLARLVLEVCRSARQSLGVEEVALSGGVWQNMTLFSKTTRLLREDNFIVYFHRLVPPNDGGLALGQALVAAARWRP